MNAIDTNVLVYALDADEPAKQAIAHALLGRLVGDPTETVLPWQVAGELLSCLRRWRSAGRIGPADVEAHFRDLTRMFRIGTPSERVFSVCFELHAKFSLSHWDSLLLAACKDLGVQTLYSEDMDQGTDDDGPRIVNPFA